MTYQLKSGWPTSVDRLALVTLSRVSEPLTLVAGRPTTASLPRLQAVASKIPRIGVPWLLYVLEALYTIIISLTGPLTNARLIIQWTLGHETEVSLQDALVRAIDGELLMPSPISCFPSTGDF